MITTNPYASNDNGPVKKTETPAKHVSSNQAQKKKGNQGKRRSTADIKISGTKSMRKPNYYLKVDTLMGNLEVYWIQVDAHNDAYQAHLHKAIEEDPFWHNLGFMAVARRRISPNNDEFMTNMKDQYPRKVMVRVLEPDEQSTPAGRQLSLQHIKNFCMTPSNNRFSYEYIIDESSDLTPEKYDHYARCDSYLQDFVICNLVKGLYDDAGPAWYEVNNETARMYWSGPDYPDIACNELGYPRSAVPGGNGKAFASTYNSVSQSGDGCGDKHNISNGDTDEVPRRSGRNRKPVTMPLPVP